MRRRALPAALLATTLLLAGCSTDTANPTASSTGGCPAAQGGALQQPASLAAWNATSGDWSLQGGTVRGSGEGGFSSLVASGGGPWRDLDATVEFRIVWPEEDAAGAGLVVHFQNATSHQIVRYSVRESGWHLFTWEPVEGRSKRQEAATDSNPLHVAGGWIHLRVTSESGVVRAFDCGAKVLEFTLPAGHSGEGSVGFFLREGTVGEFRNLRLDA